MLRLFMKYRNWIIVCSIGMAIIAFIIGQSLSTMLAPKPGEDAIGTIDGEEVLVRDQHLASYELRMLQQLGGGSVAGQVLIYSSAEDAMQWLMMIKEAEQMGLSASDIEIDDVLGRIGINQENIANIAGQLSSSPEMIRQTIKHWIMVQQYRELILGLGHISLDERFDTRPGSLLGTLMTIRQQQEQGYGNSPFFMQMAMMQLNQAMVQSLGQPRLSTPVLERLLSDLNANMKVDMVVLKAADFVSGDQPADPAMVDDLFAKYKDNLPGESEPYGFGYAFPDRIKLEYLYLPFTSVLEKVSVEPADALAFYDDNPDRFRHPADEDGNPGEVKPYEEVRQEIIDELKNQKARELAGKIMNKAQAILLDNARSLEKKDGYFVTDGFTPMTLGEVTTILSQEFNVAVHVYRRGIQWQDREMVAGLKRITPDMASGFVNYAFSVHELDPEGNSDMASRRLQVNIPSMPMTSADGNMWLLRVIDVDKAHSPQTLRDVKHAVTADAKLLAAYQSLVENKDNWLTKARTLGLAEVAKQNNTTVVSSEMFSRRQPSFDGSLNIPNLAEVGQDSTFVDELFELADGAAASGQEIAEAPVEVKSGVFGIDGKTSLVLVELQQFMPMEKSTYNSQIKMPTVVRSVNQMLSDQSLYKESFEWDAISERVGFVPERAPEVEEEVEQEATETTEAAVEG